MKKGFLATITALCLAPSLLTVGAWASFDYEFISDGYEFRISSAVHRFAVTNDGWYGFEVSPKPQFLSALEVCKERENPNGIELYGIPSFWNADGNMLYLFSCTHGCFLATSSTRRFYV